jgi:hypothetical protein
MTFNTIGAYSQVGLTHHWRVHNGHKVVGYINGVNSGHRVIGLMAPVLIVLSLFSLVVALVLGSHFCLRASWAAQREKA